MASVVWGKAHSAGLGYDSPSATEAGMKEQKELFHQLPHAFKISEHEDASPLVRGAEELKLLPYDEDILKQVLADAFTSDPSVKGDRVVNIKPQIAWNHMNIFRRRGLVLYFTGKLPVITEIAMAIDAGFEYYAVDRIFYAGNGLFEVLFHVEGDRDKFLSTPTVLLHDQVVHVLPWQPVRLIKEELLTRCPVWVELIDLPSFLWGNIKEIASSLGKVLFSPSIISPNRNRVCILWTAGEKFPETLEINLGVGRIVIYLKWGNLSGSCYHCGNLGHFTKNCPTLSESQSPMIPAYPGSKNKVPSEQVFGRSRPPSSAPGGNNPKIPSQPTNHMAFSSKPTYSGVASRGASPPHPRVRPSGQVGSALSRALDKGKRPMDADGFTMVTNKRGPPRGKGRAFSSGYSSRNIYEALHHAGNQTDSSDSQEGNLEVVMGEGNEEVVHSTPIPNQ